MRSGGDSRFSIQPHQYYRDAVEALGLEMKLWQYELNVEAAEAEAEQLRAYLKRSCRPGETIELWNLWVGDDREEKIARFQGRLGDLDREALEQLCDPPTQNGCPASAGWRSPFDFHLRAVLPGKEDQLWQAIASDASTRRSSGSCRSDPRGQGPRVSGMISVTAVETTPDLRYAKAYISVLDKENRGGCSRD